VEHALERGDSAAFTKRSGEALAFQEMNLTMQLRRSGPPLQILDGAFGGVPAGQVGCIVGESGAGKTSLLNALAGRITRRKASVKLSGDVRLGGGRIDPFKMRNILAYVEQSDESMVPTATPREALTFAAALRLEPGVPWTEREAMVEELIEKLGLSKCSDSLLGNARIRGVSGGEKRRTSIAVELVTRPSLLFIDEPTSGLDSANAKSVVQILQVVGGAGATILSTIHQPTSLIFFCFDVVVVLHRGRTVFAGPTHNLAKHLESRGVAVPEHTNPADVVLDFVVGKTAEELAPFQAKADKAWLVDAFSQDKKFRTVSEPKKPSIPTQFFWLLQRRAIGEARSFKGLLIGSSIGIFLSIVFGLLFMGAGGRNDAKVDNFSSHTGALVFIFISCQQGAGVRNLLALPIERPIFIREYRNRTYDHWIYFTCALVVEWPITLALEVTKTAIVYSLLELRGSFVVFVAAFFLLNVAICALAALITSYLNSVTAAAQLMPAVLVPQMLFVGLFVRISQIPKFLRWARHLCVLKYALGAAVLNEFRCSESSPDTVCKEWLRTNSYQDLTISENLGILALYTLCTLILGAYFLRQSIAL